MQLKVQNIVTDTSNCEEALDNNNLELFMNDFKQAFKSENLSTFSFTKEGILSLILDLNGKIAISLGECDTIIQAGKLYEKYVKKITWIGLTPEGTINYDECENLSADFLFVSSYIADTFVPTSLEKINRLTTAKIVANCKAYKSAQTADVILIDSYKLCGYEGCGVVLYNNDDLYEQLGADIDIQGVKLVYEALQSQIYKQSLHSVL